MRCREKRGRSPPLLEQAVFRGGSHRTALTHRRGACRANASGIRRAQSFVFEGVDSFLPKTPWSPSPLLGQLSPGAGQGGPHGSHARLGAASRNELLRDSHSGKCLSVPDTRERCQQTRGKKWVSARFRSSHQGRAKESVGKCQRES